MRTPQRWEQIVLPRLLSQLTPRLRKDIEAIGFVKCTNVTSTYIYGDVDTGKTIRAVNMLLTESLNLYLSETKDNETSGNMDCLFVSCTDLFNQLKQSFDNKEVREAEILYKYQNCHLLILDDLGTKNVTDWVLEMLYLILNHRYEYLKKTIITSNLDLEQLATQLDERIASRINRSYVIARKEKY